MHHAETGPPPIPGLPWPLNKAVSDTFDYLLVLRSGMVIQFAAAEDTEWFGLKTPGWITLKGAKILHPQIAADREFNFARGMVVRIADIMAAVDAPYGS
jgi:hypothetical protein